MNDDVLMYRQELIEQLCQDPIVHKFVKENKVQMSFIEENSEALKEHVEQARQCENCVGLANCTKATLGRCKELFIDKEGFANYRYVLCRYAKEKAEKEKFLKNIWISYIDEDNKLLMLNDISTEKEGAQYCQAVSAIILSLQENEKGVFLFGQPGTGKSYLLSAMANAYAYSNASVCYVRLPQLMNDLKNHIKDSEYKTNVIEKLIQCQVLILDEFGSEHVTVWTRDEILFSILDSRMTSHLKTYFASNLSLEELQTQYSISGQSNAEVPVKRLMERIYKLATPIPLIGTSRR